MKLSNATPLSPIVPAHIKAAADAAAAAPPAAAAGKYRPPAIRSKLPPMPKTMTQADLNSEALFPALKPAAPTTAGATWTQIRQRLSPPTATNNFKGVIEDRIKREKEEEERINEIVTDPLQMKDAELLHDGWSILPLKRDSRAISMTTYEEEEEDDVAKYLPSPSPNYFRSRVLPTPCPQLCCGSPRAQQDEHTD